MVLAGIIGFAGSSLLCGLTPAGSAAETWLVLARVVQGISGAVMFPAALGIVRSSFPAGGQGNAMAAFFGISGAMTAIGPQTDQREQVALDLLRKVGVRALVIDELHNLLAGRSDTRREFLNVLRYLGNQLRIPLVGVGTQEAYLAIRSDEQLEDRFEPFTLPILQPDDAARSLLASFAASYPLRRPSRLDTSQMAEYLLARSEGTIGELAALLTAAADAAITSGIEQITDTTLALADYRGPTERRDLSERYL